MTSPHEFRLTNIRSDDRRMQGRAEGFLLDNPDPGVRLRPEEELNRAMTTGQSFALFQAGEICGLSLIYKFDVPPNGPVYSEIGTMRITANGYALQSFLAKFHLLQIWLEEYTPEPPPVFAVVSPDTASAHNLEEKIGMARWEPPKDLAVVRGAAGVPFSTTKLVLLARSHTFLQAQLDLQNLHQDDKVFKTPKGSGLVHADLGWFTPDALIAKM